MAFEGIGANGSGGVQATPPQPVVPIPTRSVDALATELVALRNSDSGAAADAQRLAEQGLSPVERGQLAARIDAAAAKPAWRQAFDAAIAAPGAYAAFQRGVAIGAFEGAKSLVAGTAELVGKTIQFGADSGPAGWLGDKVRGLTGQLPGVVDAVVPSGARGAQTAEGIRNAANAVKDYAVSRARDPGRLIDDTNGFITRHWESLKADHAAAAARGPQAEAEWWGKIAGRAAFEIGITVVPIAGQAGKIAEGARVAETAVEGARVLKTGETAAGLAAQVPKLDAGDVAANAARHAQHLTLLRVTEKANPLVESLRATGKLPPNFVTKADAIAAGWKPGKALGNYVPNGQLGGDIFQNTTKILPEAPGRVWHEADVGLNSAMSRAKQPGDRLLYSSDGLLFITTDHYNSATQIGRWK